MSKKQVLHDVSAATKERWQKEAARHLLGRRIAVVRWMTADEQEACGWDHAAVVLILDNGTALYPAADDEGNDAGALFCSDRSGNELTLPVI